MQPSIVVTVAPTVALIEIEAARDHLKITHRSEDAVIKTKLATALKYVQEESGRQFMRSTVEFYFDRFPSGRLIQRLPLGYLASVESIDYTAEDGTPTAINSAAIATDYKVSTASEPGRIEPGFGRIWPIARVEIDAVKFTCKVGKLTAAEVDPRATDAVLWVLGHLFENREATTEVTLRTLPLGVTDLIQQLRFDDFVDYSPPKKI